MSSEQDNIVHQAVEHLICPTEGFIRIAKNTDAESLFHFVNKAFLKNISRYKQKGFENRFDRVQDVLNLMEKGIFLLLTASDHEQATILNESCPMVACVYIHHSAIGELTKQTVDTKMAVKINLLAVHPAMVKRGIVRYMMQVVEAVARKFLYTHILLPVVSLNQHLIDMYTKWDFNIIETKTLIDYGIDPETFAVPCHMIIMEKKLL